jgi:hypothetical protein
MEASGQHHVPASFSRKESQACTEEGTEWAAELVRLLCALWDNPVSFIP